MGTSLFLKGLQGLHDRREVIFSRCDVLASSVAASKASACDLREMAKSLGGAFEVSGHGLLVLKLSGAVPVPGSIRIHPCCGRRMLELDFQGERLI